MSSHSALRMERSDNKTCKARGVRFYAMRPALCALRLSVVLAAEMRSLDGPGQVEHRQKREHARLHEGDKEAQSQDRNRRDIGREQREHEQELMLRHHVAEETEGERHDAGKVAYELDREHERGEPPHGPHKMLDVADAVPFYADVVGRGERNKGEGEGGINVRRGRIKTGDEPLEVAHENEQEE